MQQPLMPPALALGFALACTATQARRGDGLVAPPVPTVGHVFILVEENANYDQVVGTGAMPYVDTLIGRYGLATQYYANTHPSIGNYFMMTTGQIITNNDGYAGTVRVDNVVRRLVAAGKTWKSYAEDLPWVGYTGGSNGLYLHRHNPLSSFSDVVNDSLQRKNLVPFGELASDLAGGTLPNYGFIVPNRCHDAHDCPLGLADEWLHTNIKPLIESPAFQQDGLLIIVFDEALSDGKYGGGRIVWLVVGPKVKPGYQSTRLYQQESTLRLSLEALGITGFPGAAAKAPAMGEFFRE